MSVNRTVFSAIAGALLLSGCEASEADAVDTTRWAIIDGTVSGPEDGSTIAILRDGQIFGTGILVAPNLVLVSRQIAQDASLSTSDVATNCLRYANLFSGLAVGVGPEVSQAKAAPIAVVKSITDGSETICDNDLAFFELASPITTVSPRPLRLDAPLVLGEAVRSIGFGVNTAKGGSPSQRLTGGGKVVLPAGGVYQLRPENPQSTLEPSLALVSANACNGDLGATVVDANNNILGVVTSRANAEQPDPIQPTKSCVGAHAIVTPLWMHRAFIERTLQGYGRMPWRQGQTTPPADIAGSCSANPDCNSNLCISVGDKKECSARCSTDNDCGQKSRCTAIAGQNICLSVVENPEEPASCAFQNRTAPAIPFFVVALLATALFYRRKR